MRWPLPLAFLMLGSCASGGAHLYPSELVAVVRAGVSADHWAASLPTCPPDDGRERRAGHLERAMGEVSQTLLLCDPGARCCNERYYASGFVLRTLDGESLPLRGYSPRSAYASDLDCADDVWHDTLRRTPVTVIGAARDGALEVDEVCVAP